MTLFNELWKKFKAPTQVKPNEQSVEVIDKLPETSSKVEMELSKILKQFQDTEREYANSPTVLKNLQELKELTQEPKEEELDMRYAQIDEKLGPEESYETIRQERWHLSIYCPHCESTHIKRLPHEPDETPYNHKYLCLDCFHAFSDDDDMPISDELPSINIWMRCWYLMGCTNSLTYIASVLGLELGMIEFMAEQLRTIFHANAPLTQYLDYKEWSEQSQTLRKQLKDELLQRYELLNANVAGVPKDTTEYRRQQNLRRSLTASTDPPPPKNRGRKR